MSESSTPNLQPQPRSRGRSRSGLRRPRAVIAASAAVLLATVGVLAGCSLIPGMLDGGRVDTVGTVDFTNRLAIPPLAPSTVDPDGTRVFELTAQTGSTEFHPGVTTPTWGFSGSYLGPTLVAERGEKVRVDIENGLSEPTSVHWHGMHLPAAMDGGPHQVIEPGGDWAPNWTIDQPAATLWYHPHPHGETEEHVRHGLAGLFYVEDAVEEALPLPSEYGVDDVPLIVQDAQFNSTGELKGTTKGFVGALGNELLVNGTAGPYLDVSTDLVRLRVLNASTARTYSFGFSDDRRFDLVATDGGLLERPAPLDHLRLSPGERAEIVVRVAPGETTVLRSVTPDLGIDGDGGAQNGGADSFDVLELRAAAALDSVASVPPELTSIDRLDPADAATTRELELDGFAINGESMAMDRIDQVVTLGDTEVWNVVNDMDRPHNFHIHDVQFQIAAIDGSPPPPELGGWKDTIYLPPHQPFQLVMAFEDYASAEHPYMYHCHLLWHEDLGMMGQFVVVKPGQHVTMTPGENAHHEH
ncbi:MULTISPECIES: multicopper oxidase family protein [unclassified Leifsonia]|uniref:multicopper oxidase family protein n=1 Tax=unclassified Leifsonia TaxID=2663824 RepID=UPI0009E994C5|nr:MULTISPECIES: multicopper oxidase domain-containing protein [unclassified Leifsonia]